MKIALILRKKFLGENSMEELAYSLEKNIPGLKVYELPCYSNRPLDIIKNILFVKSIKADLFDVFSVSEAYLSCFLKNVIVTCHDVKTTKGFTSWIKNFVFKTINFTIPYVFIKKMICISELTKKELIEHDKRYEKKIIVQHNPINSAIYTDLKEFNKECPKILHIGTAYRKNLLNVIKALEGVPCKLIIVGILKNDQKELLDKAKISYENYFDIPFSQIIQLYDDCDIVSFPSSYEGFGMPIIEANKMGRVVVGSDLEVFSEIADGCYSVSNPLDITSLRNAFSMVINNDEYRNNLIQLGITNAQKYSIEVVANEYVELFTSVCKKEKIESSVRK